MSQKVSEVIGRSLKKRSSTVIFLYSILFVGALVATRYVNISTIAGTTESKSKIRAAVERKTEFPLECAGRNLIQTCPKETPSRPERTRPSGRRCPSYFRWIHEDLRTWKASGITREMVEAAYQYNSIRLVVVDGKPYLERCRGCYQTRDIFTVWGILQLLRLYPGRLPDLDIMFDCGDKPVIKKDNYAAVGLQNAPPLFHYCGDDATLDIAFPDWSFWGWPEINIKPWDELKKDLAQGNKKTKWESRVPHAFWKGNFDMGDRRKIAACNSTQMWNMVLHSQNWDEETKRGFKSSNLADQCNYRYKMYIEGEAWSVSEKYILSCDSMTLLVRPQYYEFFTRSLEPMKHFWPVNPDSICQSVKFAVDWGNRHPQKTQEIARRGSSFVQEELQMEHVYDYMFHLLNEYGKLLKYKPTVPPGAMEVCSETLACSMEGLDRQFKQDTLVTSPSTTDPCLMWDQQDGQETARFLDQQGSVSKGIDTWVSQGNPNVGIV